MLLSLPGLVAPPRGSEGRGLRANVLANQNIAQFFLNPLLGYIKISKTTGQGFGNRRTQKNIALRPCFFFSFLSLAFLIRSIVLGGGGVSSTRFIAIGGGISELATCAEIAPDSDLKDISKDPTPHRGGVLRPPRPAVRNIRAEPIEGHFLGSRFILRSTCCCCEPASPALSGNSKRFPGRGLSGDFFGADTIN